MRVRTWTKPLTAERQFILRRVLVRKGNGEATVRLQSQRALLHSSGAVQSLARAAQWLCDGRVRLFATPAVFLFSVSSGVAPPLQRSCSQNCGTAPLRDAGAARRTEYRRRTPNACGRSAAVVVRRHRGSADPGLQRAHTTTT